MVVVLRMSDESPLLCRFAVSPLHETTDALRALTHPGRESYHLPWQRAVRPALADLGLGPLLALLPPAAYSPDFLTPAPAGPFTDIADELERVRTTPTDQVRAEIARCLHDQPNRATATRRFPQLSGDMACDLLVDLLEAAWRALIEPWWPQLRDVLDADITFRARQLADIGIAATLNDLHPKIEWREAALHVRIRTDADRTLSEEGIVLLPSVFGWPRVGVMLDPPAQPTVIYPARGIAELWSSRRPATADLGRLLGKTRAAILAALREPASTTGLAARCRLPASTVSEHLDVLRATGLITTTRTGRYLSHRLTALGVALTGTRQ